MRGRRGKYKLIDGDLAEIKRIHRVGKDSCAVTLPKWWFYTVGEPEMVVLIIEGDDIRIRPYQGEVNGECKGLD